AHDRRDAPLHRRGFARVPVGRGHLPLDGLRAARPRAAAIHPPLLHRRISDAADRPHRARSLTAPAVTAGRGELSLISAKPHPEEAALSAVTRVCDALWGAPQDEDR